MAFNPSPTGYFNGIVTLASGDSTPSSGVFFPYSAFESYNASTSGDIRQLVYSFIENIYDEYDSLASADRPSKLSISRTSTVPEDNIIRNTYNLVINLGYSGLLVVNE